MLKKILSENKIEIIIFIFMWFSRLIVADYGNSFHSVDVGNYILAVFEYDISVDRPHMPGYFLYVYFFKFLNLFFENGNALFVVGQSFFQALSSVFLYKIIKDKFTLKENLLIIAFIFSIPMIYLFGIMSEIYSVELLIISVFLYLIHKEKINYLLPFLAIVFGFRQSSGIFLIPATAYLFYYSFRFKNYKIKDLIISFGISIIIFFAWFLPMVNTTGGFNGYMKLLDLQNSYVKKLEMINNVISFLTYSFFYIIPITFLYLFAKKTGKINLDKINIIYLLIILPQFLFYLFYHYNKGYALLYIPALILYILFNYKVKDKVLILITTFNLLFFYFYPAEVPSFNTQVKREFRDIGLVEVWFERFNYWWLPTLSSHNVSAKLHNDIDYNQDKIYNLINNKPLLVDNSLVARGRNVSWILQDAVIIERTYKNFDSYDRHFKLEQFQRLNNLSDIIENSYVIIDKEYCDKYFLDIVDIYLELNYYYIIKSKKSMGVEYLNRNELHFVR